MNIRKKNIAFIALGAALVLLIPFVAMQVTDEVNWTLADFTIVFLLLFGMGLGYELIIRKIKSKALRYGVLGVVIVLFALVWFELAVGILE